LRVAITRFSSSKTDVREKPSEFTGVSPAFARASVTPVRLPFAS
jgi:hypothetical protein